jgi:DinB superfamily
VIAIRSAESPASRDEICAALEQLHTESVEYWSSFATKDFLAPIGDAWSPADNVRHLTKSMRAVSRGLRLPRLFVRIAFRAANRPSRTFEKMRDDYRATLARGGKAGRFAPSAMEGTVDPDAYRAQIMGYHAVSARELCAQAAHWSERDLDRLQLPHPLLGALTVREMLLFTLYHNSHHVEGVRRRLANA